MKRLAEQTLYEILEIPQDASPPAIEAAVERARALYGPGSLVTYTLMSPDEAALLGSRIDEARKVLLDPDARSRYDSSLGGREGSLRAAVSASNGALGAGANGAPSSTGASGSNGVASPLFTPVPVIPAVQAPPEPRAAPVLSASSPSSAEEPPRIALGAPVVAPPPVQLRAPIRLDREVTAPAAPPPAPVAAPPPVPAVEAAPAAAAPEDVPVPEDGVWTGPALRRVREARGLTVQQIAERTKVTRHHVENIEAERFTALPAAVYLRGILLAIARELRLDGQKVARAYLDRAAAAVQGKAR